ncbi:efflux RND transporter permease subunit [Endozoicomonas ascidiicola]|uniref:efflux RND transporter permease subunit n=1 Tax=Endozoicomonas ascidiicola TaxID=1698521 RepID=UPI00082E007E|nr:efflux RND transporter permease subunit [Endozoicomonas ascidiicola]
MDVFVKRPVLAIVLSLVILMAGLLATRHISVLQFPQIESSSLVITTHYTGVSAEAVQGFVTEPIERIAMTVPGVDYVDSNTTAGMSTVTAWLKLNENSTSALSQLTSRLSQIRSELPMGAEAPSVEVVRVDRPHAIFYLDVISQLMNRPQLTDFLKQEVTPLLSSIKGVQKVGVEGGRNPAMRVWLDPVKMSTLNIGSDEIYAAIEQNNVISSLGKTENNLQEISLLSNATLQTVTDFENMIIRSFTGGSIRLGDIARIEQGEDRGNTDARLDQRRTVYLSVYPLPGANEIEIGDELYVRLDSINQTLPEGMKINIGYDGTVYMRDALKEIFTTLAETVLLVGVVVLLLMGSLRSAIVPLVTIPISILGSIAVMLAVGFSLNLLTILAIVLSVGLVVDDAIVVVENVARHMREGRSRLDAALISSKELLSPIAAMTITLALVYIPIGFVDGLSGALFQEFAFTLATAVMISGVVAVTLSPVMSGYVLPENGRESAFTRKINALFDRLANSYGTALQVSLNYRPQILTAAVILTLLMVPFYLFSAKELAPVEDQSSIFVIAEAPPGASINYTTEHLSGAVDGLLQREESIDMWQIVTAEGGFGGINLVDYQHRDQSVHELLPSIYGQLTQTSGLRLLPTLPMPLPTAGQFDVEMVVQSQDNYEEMVGYVYQLLGAAYGTSMFMFVDTDLKIDKPLARLNFNRDLIADMGMTVSSVASQVSSLLSEQEVNRYDASGRAYKVIPMVEHQDRMHLDAILDLQIQSAAGTMIPLRSIASIEKTVGPRVMGKFNQQNAFRIFGGIVPGVTSDQALSALEAKAREILPESYTIDYAGNSRQLRQEGSSIMSVLSVAIFIVYLVLTVQFNSFRAPLVVLLGSVPLALSSAMALAFLNLTSMNIYAQIGFITLVGLIAKNGILMTEFANELQHNGQSKLTAIIEGAKVRLRPILMTTAATVLGHFPLILVSGAGAEARNSIGIILVAGMLMGTFFTLFVLPTLYLLLGEDYGKVGRKTAKAQHNLSDQLD